MQQNRKMFFDAQDDGLSLCTLGENDAEFHLVFSNTKAKKLVGSNSPAPMIEPELQEAPLF